jgi:glycine/D-amino acid oxidase-like deaminating enzyme
VRRSAGPRIPIGLPHDLTGAACVGPGGVACWPRVRDYRAESFWLDGLEEDLAPRPALAGDHTADVVIVGAGFTGLWTAWALREAEPSLRVVLCESDIVGAGASGRNGGWCMGELSALPALFEHPRFGPAALRLQRMMFGAVDRILSTIREAGIECSAARGGRLALASVGPQHDDLRRDLERLRRLGFGDEDYAYLDPHACRAHIGGREFLGAIHARHSAVLDPARLVRGLARVLEARGVSIFEQSPVVRVESRGVETGQGRVRAGRVVLATEAYGCRLPGWRRRLVPIHSMMIATAPLGEDLWREIGLRARECFADRRRVTTYGQRTADGRIAFGSRGRYFFGSRSFDRFDPGDREFERVREALLEILPPLRDVPITHRWGGAVAVPRDWQPSLGIDPRTGIAFAGGYVGEGVAASHLFGYGLADLVLDRPGKLAEMPFFGRIFPNWEPEPLRWVGVTAVRKAGEIADRAESGGRGRNRFAAGIFDRLVRH